MTSTGQNMAYVGEFTHQLDARNRVTVPSSWRVAGDDGNYYFAWPHPEGCIVVYPPHMLDELLEKARGIQQSNVRSKATLRQLFSSAYKFGCDKQGRILLPDPLKQRVGIQKQVSLVGLGHYFEIWDAAKRETDESDFDLLEAMAEMGI
jgi:MraZ protein